MQNLFDQIKSFSYEASQAARARYWKDEISMRAMSLTYSTLLSMVPFLAVMFSVLKGFGVQNVIEPFLKQMLHPLGPSAATQITNLIINFVNNIRVGVLGGLGVAMLFYTVVNLVANIEDALNQIWGLPRSRSWSERFTAYLSVVLVGPVLIFTAFALSASAQNYWLFERLTEFKLMAEFFTLVTSVIPFVLLCATFTFLYKFLPYTDVRLASALLGGATAGLLWQGVGFAFAAFVANSSRYAAIYSSFAVMVVFLTWLYVAWLIFLIGAEVAYFHQHPGPFLRDASRSRNGRRFEEWVALAALNQITRRYLAGMAPWQPPELAVFLGVSSLEDLVQDFVRAGILLKSAEPEGVTLARPPETVSVKEIFDIVDDVDSQQPRDSAGVMDVLSRKDQVLLKAFEGMTLKTLASENLPRTYKFSQIQSR